MSFFSVLECIFDSGFVKSYRAYVVPFCLKMVIAKFVLEIGVFIEHHKSILTL